MLTAKYIDTKEIIDITKFSNPRQEIDKKKLVCKLCDNPVSIRHGLVRAKHFYHLSTCTCDFFAAVGSIASFFFPPLRHCWYAGLGKERKRTNNAARSPQ
jgi:hypothetical protein